jgi:hypothetical protein
MAHEGGNNKEDKGDYKEDKGSNNGVTMTTMRARARTVKAMRDPTMRVMRATRAVRETRVATMRTTRVTTTRIMRVTMTGTNEWEQANKQKERQACTYLDVSHKCNPSGSSSGSSSGRCDTENK